MSTRTARGSCVCGEFTYALEGEPTKVAICYCTPCKKTAGCNGAYEYVFPIDKVEHLSGNVKKFSRKGESGKYLHYSICDTCATIMWCAVDSIPGILLVKAGTLDDREYEEKLGRPTLEIFTKNRPSWCPEWQDVVHRVGA